MRETLMDAIDRNFRHWVNERVQETGEQPSRSEVHDYLAKTLWFELTDIHVCTNADDRELGALFRTFHEYAENILSQETD